MTSRRVYGLVLIVAVFVFVFSNSAAAQNPYENRRIDRVDITFEGSDQDVSAADQFRLIASQAAGSTYSTVKLRDAIARLYESGRIVSASVEATLVGSDRVNLRFIIQRKSVVRRITVNVEPSVGETVTEQQVRLQLNLINPGTTFSEKDLQDNSNLILTYLRDRGFFNARVRTKEVELGTDKDVEVVFEVDPGTQATIENIEIEVSGYDAEILSKTLKLTKGALFTRQKVEEDQVRVREKLRKDGYLAPSLLDPRIVYDDEQNSIGITIRGKVGAKIDVVVDSEEEKVGEGTQTELLPVKREGTIDYSAIVEGQRRLETYYQEKGYFFARVNPECSVTPPFGVNDASSTDNGTEELCAAMSGADLTDREVEIKYVADLNRRLRLDELRIEGTDLFNYEDVSLILESQPQSVFSLIPFFGYGRGYTSIELLRRDRNKLASLLGELGYREAQVGIKQGVSLNGEDLIITFVIREGRPTEVVEVDVDGNQIVPTAQLLNTIPKLLNERYSRARTGNARQAIAKEYADRGHYYASVSTTIVELPDDDSGIDKIKLVFEVENEGKPVYVNRILLNGNEQTKDSAITRALELEPDKVLRQTDIFASEQRLYSTDAFDNVRLVPEPAGEKTDGSGILTDIIANFQEKPPRLITYGGGFSTDVGLSGFFDIRHFNLFGNLQQGGVQVRWSQRQQLVQLDFVDPRFWRDGNNLNGTKRFSPLRFTLQYQRDSTVTRFFRSTFDRGTFGIVQRIDENGVPIDEFGNAAGDPTLNRFTASLETSRTVSTRDRSIVFFKYRFEDVRLFNFDSLLISELLEPDARIRISGANVTFVRDTRKNCDIKYTFLDLVALGGNGENCRYNASDPTDGDFLTTQFDFSTPTLGANIGFTKFQLSYNRYYTIDALKKTTLAARAIIGVANVFSNGDRFTNTQFPGLNGSLPISERFFAGGSTTIRGFDFEQAGPRVVVVPQGTFRDQQGSVVSLDPFTIPFGGNALAVVNLEARVPLTESVRAVPFYDGGNVFKRPGEIFNPANSVANDPFSNNIRSVWSHTVGFGLRIATPIGGEFAVDYGYLLNPPSFLIPQQMAPNANFRIRQGQLHFRFSQAF